MKKLILPVLGLCSALIMACSSDSSPTATGEPGTPGEPTPGEPAPGGETGGNSSADVPAAYYATLPTANQTAVQTMYNSWIAKYYVTAEEEMKNPEDLGNIMQPKLQGSARIKFDKPLNTVSEGIGYGMLITYFMKDWEKFDRLFKYYQAYPVSAEAGLYFMKWNVIGDTFNGGFTLNANGSSATDADLDVATALLLAYAETGKEEYLDYGKKIASSIHNTEINETTNLLMPGNSGLHMADGYVYNTSYFSLVGLRLFAKYDTEHTAKWNQVIAATQAYMKKVQDAGNGLWPDWSDANGSPINPENNSSTGKLNNFFGLESVRIPLRLIWDYNWYGDENTKGLVTKAAQFAVDQTGGDIMKVSVRYIYQGEQPMVGLGGAHFKGGFCSLWTVDANFAQYTNACNSVISNGLVNATNYFEPTLQLMYALYLNGYFTKVFNY